MSGPWFKCPRDLLRHPRARSLSLSAKGLWLMMLDIMDESSRRGVLLMDGQPVPDDVMASMAGVQPSELDDMVRELRTAGLLSVDGSGVIRCDWLTSHDKASRKGKANAQKRWKKDVSQPTEKPETNTFGNGAPNGEPNGPPNAIDPDLDLDFKKETSSLSSKPAVSKRDDEINQALLTYHASAERVGWPKVKKVTSRRKASLIQRVKDAGGLDGWKAAMVRAERSSFLRGEKTDWRADFDFLLQQSSFLKLLEGKYDDRPPGGLKAAPPPTTGPFLYRVYDDRCERQDGAGNWLRVPKTPAEIDQMEAVKERGCEFDWSFCSEARAAELLAELETARRSAA